MRRELMGNEHPAVAISLNELALVLQDEGRLTEAEATSREALALRRRVMRPEDSNLAVSAENLALLLCREGQFAEAETLARESLSIRESNSPDDWGTFNARSLVGAALLGQQRPVDAEPLLLSGAEGMERLQERIPAGSRAASRWRRWNAWCGFTKPPASRTRPRPGNRSWPKSKRPEPASRPPPPTIMECDKRLPRRFQWNECFGPPSPFVLSPGRGDQLLIVSGFADERRANPIIYEVASN